MLDRKENTTATNTVRRIFIYDTLSFKEELI